MDAAEIVAAIREARRTGGKLDPAALAGRPDTLQVEPESLTATVPAGYPLDQLQAELARFGLFYPPGWDLQGAGSVGSHLASGRSGPWRLNRGTARDWVLGLEVVTGQGEVIRTGSRVVKNVAGLDLTKLMIGSRGSLGVITQAFLRLAPLPEARAIVAARFAEPAQALAALPALLAGPLGPGALELWGAHLIVGLEGTPADLPRRIALAQDALRRAGGTVVEDLTLPVPPLPHSATLARAGFPAAAAGPWLAALPAGTPLHGHAGSGIYWAVLPAEGALLTELLQLAQAHNGYMTVERRDAPLPPALLQRAPGLTAIEARIRQLFDPDGIFRQGGDTGGA